MEIKRDIYLRKLIDRMNNGLVKVVTGKQFFIQIKLIYIFLDYMNF